MITLDGHEVMDLALQYVQCGGKQIMVYTVRQKEMSCSDIRIKGGKGGQKVIINLTRDTRESFTEEMILS